MATIELDGSQGEGGGQVLRSALALSLVTGTPFHLANVRAGRERPGLLRQHLTAVRAAAEVGGARVTGAELGSRDLAFVPGPVKAGDYRFSIGSAGSATLVFQAIFPALALASGRSTVVVEGGTHNSMAPPWEFLARAYLPLVARMGPKATATLEQAGFFPAGGGRLRVAVEPAQAFGRLELLERGDIQARRVTALLAQLGRSIGERELAVVRERLGWEPSCGHVEQVARGAGPGNAVVVEVECEQLTEVFTAFGERRVTAEAVGAEVAAEAAEWLAAGVPVGRHLADQLLLPMALGGGGTFRTVVPTLHTRTNAEVIRAFLGAEVEFADGGERGWTITVPGRGEAGRTPAPETRRAVGARSPGA
jgi:RNA 3'-terminal phosphate cyclase (ATP)